MLMLPPRSSWLYQMSVSLSPIKRYLLTLLFMAALTFIWFHYVYEPLNNRIDVMQQDAHISEKYSPEEIAERISLLHNELNESSSLSCDDQMAMVLGCIDRAGIALENCSMQDKALYVQAIGTYAQCLAFFEQLATLSHPFLPRDVRIARGVDNLYSLSLIILLREIPCA